MSDKIEEIRERHAGYSLNSGNAGKANEDRGWLLAEVERLREALKDIDALNPDVPDALGASDLRVIVAQMGDLAVKALEGKHRTIADLERQVVEREDGR